MTTESVEITSVGTTPAVGRFGVVTALPEEFAAMCIMLDDWRDLHILDDPNEYRVGSIPAADGSGQHIVVVTLLKKAGNNSAASAAAHLLRSFPSVRDILMVGIAGGCPHPTDVGKHVRLGDLVVSNEYGVVQYDQMKLSEEKVELRDTSAPPSAALVGKIKILEADRLFGKHPWEENILRASSLLSAARPAAKTDNLFDSADVQKRLQHPSDPTRRRGKPKVHYGRIGAANILLKDPKLRDVLRDGLNVRAIEMESSGIADSTWIDGKSYILIRGICDYCDSHKNDLWHGYAAVVAAAYARALIAACVVPTNAADGETAIKPPTTNSIQFFAPAQNVQIGNHNRMTTHLGHSENPE